ncbi:hypothetical protein ACVW1C_005807 [Bradyrhizobium sp. USDA 4011]
MSASEQTQTKATRKGVQVDKVILIAYFAKAGKWFR